MVNEPSSKSSQGPSCEGIIACLQRKMSSDSENSIALNFDR